MDTIANVDTLYGKYKDKFVLTNTKSKDKSNNYVSVNFNPQTFDEFTYFGSDHLWSPQDKVVDFYDYLNELSDWSKSIKKDTLYESEEDKKPSDGAGDLVEDHDETTWEPPKSTATSDTLAPQYNVTKAIETLEKNAHSKSTTNCALYVRYALNAGGVPITGKGNANGYGKYFRSSKEWTEVLPWEVQPGDVCVTFNNRDGHLSMWTGKLWISDFRLKGPHVYTDALDGKNTFYFRYTG